MNYWQPAIVAFQSNYLPAYKAAVIYVPIRPYIYVPIRHYICREPSTNQLLFMQNKPNFQDTQMNVSSIIIMIYKYFIPLAGQKNKPNSNPIKPNFKKAQMNVNLTLTKDYRENVAFIVRKNKPNSKPISETPKMNANVYVIEDYENKTAFRPQKNKPKTKPISSKAKMNKKSLAGKSGHTISTNQKKIMDNPEKND